MILLISNFPITKEKIFKQLTFYTGMSKHYYMRFMVLDYIFPPLAAVFTALLWAWLLHLIRRQWVHRVREKKLVLFPFVAALLDWAENVGFLGTVLLYPSRIDWLTSSGGLL